MEFRKVLNTWASRALLLATVIGFLPITLTLMLVFFLGMAARNSAGWVYHWARWLVGDSQHYSDTWTLVGRALTVDLIQDRWNAPKD